MLKRFFIPSLATILASVGSITHDGILRGVGLAVFGLAAMILLVIEVVES